MDELIFDQSEEFWTYIKNSVLSDDPYDTDSVNKQVVTFVKTVADHVHIFVNDDQDLYRCGIYFINSEIYELNKVFCIAKLLSFLTIDMIELNFKFIVSYVLLLDCKNDSSLLQVVQDYNGFKVIYQNVHFNLQQLAMIDDQSNTGTIRTIKQACTAQLDILFQICKYSTLDKDDLALIEPFCINYIFESLLVEEQEDVFNSAKFKFILALNEQFMIASRERNVENAIFKSISENNSSRNFNECLLVYFNREEDRCLQIMMSKILYLIFTNKHTAESFYHNDLNVLVDVLIRNLNDLSENEESIINTFLRVLYPILKNKQFQDTRYKRDKLLELLKYFAGQSESKFWKQTETTKRLALKCLTIDWLSEDEIAKEAIKLTPSNNSVTSLNSLNSMSKQRPPPPLPRKIFHRTKAVPPIPSPRIR